MIDILPQRDLIGHEPSDDCPCGPRMEPVERTDGSIGWVIVHQSLDGRERLEEHRSPWVWLKVRILRRGWVQRWRG